MLTRLDSSPWWAGWDWHGGCKGLHPLAGVGMWRGQVGKGRLG